MLQLPSEIQIFPFDASATQPQLLVASQGKHYQIAGAIPVAVLQELQGSPCSLTELQNRVKNVLKADCGLSELRSAVLRLQQKGFILDDEHSSVPESPPAGTISTTKPSYFALKLNVISPSRLRPLVLALSPLFSPNVMSVALPLLAVVLVFYWVAFAMPLGPLISNIGGRQISILIVCNYLGLFMHEVGHAAACVRNGVKHGYIGIGLYLIFPVFYTDVSESWRVPRVRRMAIDAGGIYISLLLAVVSAIAAVTTGSVICALWCFLNTLVLIGNINPFVRMDGYWLVSDALGIPNLMQSNRELTKWIVLYGMGNRDPRPKILNLPRIQRFLYFAYYLAFCLFSAWFVYQFVAWYLPHLSFTFRQTILLLRGPHAATFSEHGVGQIMRLLIRCVPAVGLLIYFIRFVMRRVRQLGGYRFGRSLQTRVHLQGGE